MISSPHFDYCLSRIDMAFKRMYTNSPSSVILRFKLGLIFSTVVFGVMGSTTLGSSNSAISPRCPLPFDLVVPSPHAYGTLSMRLQECIGQSYWLANLLISKSEGVNEQSRPVRRASGLSSVVRNVAWITTCASIVQCQLISKDTSHISQHTKQALNTRGHDETRRPTQ